MTVGRRARRWSWLLIAAALALVAACDGQEPRAGDAPPTASVATADVALSPGDEPVVVAAWGDDLLVGSRAPEGSATRPRLTVLDASGGSREVAVTPVSPTAFQAKWLVAAPRGATVELVGGAPAGAHSNTRWSTWRGDAAAVRELPQPFATFGGWGAGALVSLVPTPSAPVIVGSWESGGAGLDIALWHPEGDRWVRASSAGTALASTATELVSARGAAADRAGLLVVGSVTSLGDGRVTQRPAMWRAPGPNGPWTRTDLPGEGALGEAHAAACDEQGRCTLVGAVDGSLRGWVLGADGSTSPLALPALAVGEHDLLSAPLLGDATSTVLLASGGSLQVLTVPDGASAGGTSTGSASGAPGDGIRQATGPRARGVRSAARTSAGDYLVLEDPAGTARLVRLSR
jgi:hypothetical protein